MDSFPLYSEQYFSTRIYSTRQIIIALLAAPDIEIRRGIRPKTKKQVPQVVRFDNKNHLVNKIETQPRCVDCGICAKFFASNVM